MTKAIGWVALKADGSPKRPESYAYGKIEYGPPRIYKTETMAKSQSPSGLVAEVFLGPCKSES